MMKFNFLKKYRVDNRILLVIHSDTRQSLFSISFGD